MRTLKHISIAKSILSQRVKEKIGDAASTAQGRLQSPWLPVLGRLCDTQHGNVAVTMLAFRQALVATNRHVST